MASEADTAAASPPQAIILAAGKGTRMAPSGSSDPARGSSPGASAGGKTTGGGGMPKVCYEVAGRPMVWWVVRACREAGVERCILVIGYEGQQVRDALADEPDCEYVEQNEQLGTGHAALMARPLFEGQPACDVFVLAGDGPLIRPDTLATLLATHRRARAAATLATAVLDDPTGYGRVVRDASGGLDSIVEHKDASPDQLAIREVNPSYYCFRSDLLFDALSRVSNDNTQGEYYITDVPGMLKREGHVVSVVDAVPAADVHSVNTPRQLALVDDILRRRIASKERERSSAMTGRA